MAGTLVAIILDTSVIIDVDRGISDEKAERLDSKSPHKISAVPVTEYFTGTYLHEGEVDKAESVLRNAEEIPVEREIARKADKIIAALTEEGVMIGMNDVYIAATARVLDEPLLTSDVEHFRTVNGIEAIDWT